MVQDCTTSTREDRQRDKELLENPGSEASKAAQDRRQQRHVPRRNPVLLDAEIAREDGFISIHAISSRLQHHDDRRYDGANYSARASPPVLKSSHALPIRVLQLLRATGLGESQSEHLLGLHGTPPTPKLVRILIGPSGQLQWCLLQSIHEWRLR